MRMPQGLKFDEKGLVTAVMQDAGTGEVLMVAFMNAEALAKTLETGLAHFWSRSRGKLWLKGESSGHVQKVKEVRVDCDADAVLLKIEQKGGACHAGYRSCFYRRLKEDGGYETAGEKVFDPGTVYK
ncbi:MAG TPA: phosphoribosyl-AMP cyclohydrolase [bacterium]|nr:phosphoribosyl-AMP cyclohydrolase [Chlamydiota bacterium]HOE28083.1 phosphoribosyl-AMP cyclohydrolase [bacterium]HQM51941.1 phosphoribosyl-AMP cyclohydrolase [bacterium]